MTTGRRSHPVDWTSSQQKGNVFPLEKNIFSRSWFGKAAWKLESTMENFEVLLKAYRHMGNEKPEMGSIFPCAKDIFYLLSTDTPTSCNDIFGMAKHRNAILRVWRRFSQNSVATQLSLCSHGSRKFQSHPGTGWVWCHLIGMFLFQLRVQERQSHQLCIAFFATWASIKTTALHFDLRNGFFLTFNMSYSWLNWIHFDSNKRDDDDDDFQSLSC